MSEVLHPHSWKYAEIVQVTQNEQGNALVPQFVTRTRYFLQQYAPVKLQFHSTKIEMLCEQLNHIPTIFSLDADTDNLATLLQHPKMQTLRQISTAQNISHALVDRIAALPRLVSVSFWPRTMIPNPPSASYQLLQRLLLNSQLTELGLFGGRFPEAFTLLQNMPHNNLQRLHICWTGTYHRRLDTFFSSMACQNLREVSLSILTNITAEEVRGALAAMQRVHTLRLSLSLFDERMTVLSQLAAAPALVRVFLDYTVHAMPPLNVLCDHVIAIPALHFVINVSSQHLAFTIQNSINLYTADIKQRLHVSCTSVGWAVLCAPHEVAAHGC